MTPIVEQFVQEAGHMTQSLGVGRVLGQIYAYLYFSREPRALGDMERDLHISKGSASMGVRQLESWTAVRKIWVKGDRKDYYEANDWFGRILKSLLTDAVGSKLQSLSQTLDAAEDELAEVKGNGELGFVRDRVTRLRQFQGKATKAWGNPVFQRLLR